MTEVNKGSLLGREEKKKRSRKNLWGTELPQLKKLLATHEVALSLSNQ